MKVLLIVFRIFFLVCLNYSDSVIAGNNTIIYQLVSSGLIDELVSILLNADKKDNWV